MQTNFTKYSFRIKTREGSIIEKLTFHGANRTAAENRLRQIYRHCEILACSFHGAEHAKSEMNLDFDSVVSLMM